MSKLSRRQSTHRGLVTGGSEGTTATSRISQGATGRGSEGATATGRGSEGATATGRGSEGATGTSLKHVCKRIRSLVNGRAFRKRQQAAVRKGVRSTQKDMQIVNGRALEFKARKRIRSLVNGRTLEFKARKRIHVSIKIHKKDDCTLIFFISVFCES